MAEISDDEVMTVISRIESGALAVVCDIGWHLDGWGGVTFATADGWRFIVFNDGGQWDYVECVYAPDGRSLGCDEIEVTTPRLDAYCPRTVEIARHWGLGEAEAHVLVRHS